MRCTKLFFNLGKGDFTLRNSNGFSVIEVLIAVVMLFSLVSTFLPIIVILDAEQKVLSERRELAYKLHDKLQQHIWNSNHVTDHLNETNSDSHQATFHFQEENGFIKGCAVWNNAKKREETLCLYGLPNK